LQVIETQGVFSYGSIKKKYASWNFLGIPKAFQAGNFPYFYLAQNTFAYLFLTILLNLNNSYAPTGIFYQKSAP
jgi:hypothetical protein